MRSVWGGWRLRPQKCTDVRKALKKLGFEQKRHNAGSHEHWEGYIDGQRRLVTVACHNGEVKKKDLHSIISQAGVSRREFMKHL